MPRKIYTLNWSKKDETGTHVLPEKARGTVQEAVDLLDKLMHLAGFDRSESSTEIFAELLGDASRTAKKEVTRSHRSGLSLDTRWTLAEFILGVERGSNGE